LKRYHYPLLAGVFVYILYVVMFQHLAVKNELTKMNNHADVIAEQMWDYNIEAMRSYLTLACDSRHYKRIELNGEKGFISETFKGAPLEGADAFFISVGLMNPKEISADVVRNNVKIATMTAHWYPQWIYTHLYVLLCYLLVIAVLILIKQILDDKAHLEQQVKARTRDLEKARSYLDNVFNSMPSMLIGIDPNGTIMNWNSQAVKATGISKDDAVGQSIDSIYPRLKDELEVIKQCIKSRSPYSDMRRTISDHVESVKIEDLTAFPLVSNGIDGVVIRLDDVTERVRMEELMIQSE